jgi:hypothetical protein
VKALVSEEVIKNSNPIEISKTLPKNITSFKKTFMFKSLFLMTFLLIISCTAIQAHKRDALSTHLKPQKELDYYADQAMKYFDTLDTYASRDSKPNYAKKVIRWEWYPWLFLTGYKDHWMNLDRLVILYPTKVINRDCRAFKEQPFARCRVTFHYLKSDSFVDIYEEFSFNDQGEMTFVEAWSDIDELMPMDPNTDFWAQGNEVKRLSTKVPGLGSEKGKIDKKALRKLAKSDSDLKNLKKRLRFTIFFWTKEAIRLVIKGHGHD